MGAYLAMKDHYGEDLNLTSVMGSSAGGILGLAISCHLETNEIKDLIVNDLRHITHSDKKHHRRNLEKEREFLIIISNLLSEYGIVDTIFLDKIAEIIKDSDFQRALLELLGEMNEAFRDLLSDTNF